MYILSLSFYGAYIRNKIKLIDATNKLIWLVIHGDRQQLSFEHGTAENVWWRSNFKQICFQFFSRKGIYSFRRFNRYRELIPKRWRSHRKSTFANTQLSLITRKRCLEMDDLRVLDILEKCRRLTKHVGC